MGERTEVRVSDQDPEMAAIKAIAAALGPLDSTTAARVLKWADEKYGLGYTARMSAELRSAITADMTALMEAWDKIQKAAKQLGVTANQLMATFVRMYEQAIADAEAEAAAAPLSEEQT